jgi:deoxyribonuclease V
MRIPRAPHRWAVTPKQAIRIQQRLCGRVCICRPGGELRLIAGCDLAFSRDGTQCLAAVVVWDRVSQQVVEQRQAVRPVRFPYVPGLLSFREIPALLAAFRKLAVVPDGVMCDGQGWAHPRRFGLACHVGVLLGLPTIGCAKSILIGAHERLASRRGSRTSLVHDGEEIGTVLRTQAGVRPVYVSIGHNIDLPTAEEIVLSCAVRYRLPEPTRLADRLVAATRRESVP